MKYMVLVVLLIVVAVSSSAQPRTVFFSDTDTVTTAWTRTAIPLDRDFRLEVLTGPGSADTLQIAFGADTVAGKIIEIYPTDLGDRLFFDVVTSVGHVYTRAKSGSGFVRRIRAWTQ